MKQRVTAQAERTPRSGAFTLIELLVVISIIGVLAALVLPLSGVATTKMRISRVKAELNQYVTAIENYKAEVGFYPPDNEELRKVTTDTFLYSSNAAFNPLYYELTGALFTNNMFRSVAEQEETPPAALNKTFNVNGVQNSARNKHDLPYKGFSIKASQHSELDEAAYSTGGDVEVLSVPVPGPFELKGDKNRKINPWFYDSSTTNRHNKATYDLWAEIIIGRSKETLIIGNWKN